MISAESAIRSLRRDLTLTSLLKAVLLGSAMAALLAGPVYGSAWSSTGIVVGIAAVWLLLSYRSALRSNAAADSPLLIASGQFDEAEQRIESALRGFSIFRTAKLLSLHHLSVLRHAQHRWRESALLSKALLRQRLGSLQTLAHSSRLMLADALLELNDLRGAHEALSSLYHERLTLGESINLLAVQWDYEAAIGAWPAMIHNVMSKVQLAELMPSSPAARAQMLLALAAKKCGRNDLADWLRRRAELLCDVNALVAERPVLKELLSV